MVWLGIPLAFIAITALLVLLAFFESLVYVCIALLIWWSFRRRTRDCNAYRSLFFPTSVTMPYQPSNQTMQLTPTRCSLRALHDQNPSPPIDARSR